MARGDCPNGHGASFGAPGEPYGAVRCAACGGTFFFGKDAVKLIEIDAGVKRSTLLGLAGAVGVGRKSCPACESRMDELPLKGTQVDWCRTCGGLFLDHGELWRVSGGRHPEPERPHPPAADPAPSGVPVVAHAHEHALPGRPTGDAMALLDAFIGHAPSIEVKQRHRMGEVIFGVELANQYAILPAGGGVGHAQELTHGFLTVLARLFMPSIRALELEVRNDYDAPCLTAKRPVFLFFSKMTVEAADGTVLGSVTRTFHVIYKSYELRNARGQVFARVKSPFWRLWTFPVLGVDGRERAVIRKNWGGLIKESMTDADVFRLELQDGALGVDERAVLLATTLSIDLDYFSRHGGKGGALRLLGD